MIAGDILGERARVLPDKCALVFVPTGERFSYAQLNRMAEQMARIWTAQLGLRKGERIGILAQNSPEYVCAFFAAGKTGMVLVPLNSRQTAHELSFVVQDAGVSALLYETQFTAIVRELYATRPQMKLLALDGPAWQAAMAATGSGVSGEAEFQNAVCAGLPSASIRPTGQSPEDLYCLLYTSGSTGRPKGVMIPHRMVLWNAYNTAVSWQMRDSDVIPIITPLHHAGGLTVFLTPALLLGATIVLHRGFDASEIWRTVERERATLLMGVPTIFKMLMDAPEFTTVDVSSVRWFISGGAPLPLYLTEAYLARGIVLKQGYGLTEVGVNCFVISEQDARRKPGSIGRPMLFSRAKLIGASGDEAAPVEFGRLPIAPSIGGLRQGELCLNGPHVSLGYWNNPEATAAALDSEGWFHTGDNVRVDEEGFFYIVGRTREMFISGGVNVHPAEIEAELLLHPQVEDAAVIGVEHEKWGEVGAAFVVLRNVVLRNEKQAGGGEVPSGEELSAFLARRLARYKLPHHYIFLSALPRSAFGKVLKPELHKLFAERKQSSAGP